MEAPLDSTPAALVLPEELANACDYEGYRWVVLKVDARIDDWRAALQGARLQLGPPTALQAPNCNEQLTVFNDGHGDSERPHLLPLTPSESGSNKLKFAADVHAVVRVVQTPEAFSAEAIAPDINGGTVRLKPMPANEQRQVLLGFWRVGPTTKGAHSKGEDTPLAKMRLKCWQLPVRPGKARRLELTGKFTDAKNLRLVGKSTKPDKTAALTWRYLLGGLEDGGKKMHLFETDFFVIDRAPDTFNEMEALNNYAEDNTDAANAEGDEPKEMLQSSFHAQRRAATQAYGTAAKKRLKETETSRTVKAEQVSDVVSQAHLDQMREKAEAHKGKVASIRDQEIASLRSILPAFSLEATDPLEIFKEGVAHIASDEALVAEDKAEEGGFLSIFRGGETESITLTELLQKPVGELLQFNRAKLAKLCKSPLVCAVVVARAEGGLQETSKKHAERIIRRLGVLYCLMEIFKARRKKEGVIKKSHLATMLPIAFHSQLFRTWFSSFLTPVHDRNSGKINDTKVFCHAMVWALYMTPKISLNVAGLLEDAHIDQADLKRLLTTMGCSCDTKRPSNGKGVMSMEAKLKAPLKINEDGGGGGGRKRKRR